MKKYWRHLILDAANKHEISLKEKLRIINESYDKFTIYPEKSNIFRAFKECPLDELKVVWLGQDPYHDGHATGLCMGIEEGRVPPTLRILNKVLKNDYDRNIEDLTFLSWAKQGVLLLNAALTVREGIPGSHMNFWKPLIEAILEEINNEKKDVIWVALGVPARSLIMGIKGINEDNVVSLPHPMASVYSGKEEQYVKESNLFKKINQKLTSKIHF